MTITIKEIAEISGVSTATVSRVINSPDKVSDKTKKNVLEVINKYDYKPNQLAKNFSSNRTNNIALFIYDIVNPFFTELIKELNTLSFDRGYSLIICDSENKKERELEYIDYINRNKFAGVILTEGISDDPAEELKDSYPIVSIDREIERCANYSLITSANLVGAKKAMEYLVTLNHQKIGFIAGKEGMKTANDRKKGYLEIVEKYELPVDKSYIYEGDFSRESGVKALEYFLSLEESPTAIFSSNDLMAEGLLARAFSLNIDIPQDLSVVGFDGTSPDINYELTTVKQSIRKIAEKSIEELSNRIKGTVEEKNVFKIPVELVVGETCQKI